MTMGYYLDKNDHVSIAFTKFLSLGHALYNRACDLADQMDDDQGRLFIEEFTVRFNHLVKDTPIIGWHSSRVGERMFGKRAPLEMGQYAKFSEFVIPEEEGGHPSIKTSNICDIFNANRKFHTSPAIIRFRDLDMSDDLTSTLHVVSREIREHLANGYNLDWYQISALQTIIAFSHILMHQWMVINPLELDVEDIDPKTAVPTNNSLFRYGVRLWTYVHYVLRHMSLAIGPVAIEDVDGKRFGLLAPAHIIHISIESVDDTVSNQTRTAGQRLSVLGKDVSIIPDLDLSRLGELRIYRA